SIRTSRTGLSLSGTSGLGKLTVKGRKRTPLPPARITARRPAAFIDAFSLGFSLLIWCIRRPGKHSGETECNQRSAARPHPGTLWESSPVTVGHGKDRTRASPPRFSLGAGAPARLQGVPGFL